MADRIGEVPVAGLAGLDEASARSMLAAMQDRLARDPASALGLVASASASEIRAAFLRLTKQYHPVRFGRMALDIQRLSNEVFLALRAAHDALIKAARRPTGQMPAIRGSSPALASSPSAVPSAVPGQPHVRAPLLLPARPARSPSASDTTGERPPAAAPPTSTPPGGSKLPASRITGQLPVVRPPGSLRQTGGYPIVAPPDEAVAIDLLQRREWDQARTVLHQLLARDPSAKRLRALMCYARGREAQLERRLDDARVELQEALDLDPDLQLAKTALTELFTRRK